MATGRTAAILKLLLSVFAAAVLVAFVAGFSLGFWPQFDNFVTAAMGDTLFDIVLSTLYGGARFIYSTAEPAVTPDRPKPIA